MAKLELQCVGERRLLLSGEAILELLRAAGVDVDSEGSEGELRVRIAIRRDLLRPCPNPEYVELDVPVAPVATEQEGMYVNYVLPTQMMKLGGKRVS